MAAPTVWNELLSFEPSVVTAVTITTAIRATIRPYSQYARRPVPDFRGADYGLGSRSTSNVKHQRPASCRQKGSGALPKGPSESAASNEAHSS